MKKLDLKTANYFPWVMILISPLLLLFGVVLMVEQIFWGVLLAITGILFLTTHYRFIINEERKEYNQYLWILGLRHGKTIPYEGVSTLFITKSRIRQTVNSRVSSMTVSKAEYNGFIQFDGGKNVHLFARDKKQALVQSLKPISNFIKIPIHDLSGE